MTLLSGAALDPKRFFKSGNPISQSTSFDLTVGAIIDHNGKKVEGPFILKPGNMVQVCTAEVFDLPSDVTGHVTYKTTQTQKGIWALTVGIVDPGWDGPISTTLLNFSRVDYPISEGDAFLRVSLFEHTSVPDKSLREAPTPENYLANVQKLAGTIFPKTFLDTDEIISKSGDAVLQKIRTEALSWIIGIALILSLIQVIANYFQPAYIISSYEMKIKQMENKLLKLEDIERKIDLMNTDSIQ